MGANIKLISWNVNGLRAVLRKGTFVPFVKAENPEILCLQETKAAQGQADIDLPGYEEIWNSAERKGYSGTAIFTKHKPLAVLYDLPGVELGKLKDKFGDALTEGRVITMEFESHFVVTVYTPNAKRGLERLEYRHKHWDPHFLQHLKALEKKKPVIVCGDFNVAHQEIDLARPKDNVKNAGFTPEEREGMDKLLGTGFVDTFRHLHPKKTDHYSWWSNFGRARERNVGWRIDYFLTSKKLKSRIADARIHMDVMGSDHAPVQLILKH